MQVTKPDIPDFLSKALTQAQVDLDTYDYSEEDSLSSTPSLEAVTPVVTQSQIIQSTAIKTVSTPGQQKRIILAPVSGKSSSDFSVRVVPSGPALYETSLCLDDEVDEIETESTFHGHDDHLLTVAVDSNPEMHLIDTEFLSLQDPEIESVESVVETDDIIVPCKYDYDIKTVDGSLSPRLSKRKRRPPAALLDESPPRAGVSISSGHWVRDALSFLSRVARFKGNTNLTEAAADWFVRPVDLNEAPDYYEFVRTPMDFTTIRRKLETAQYTKWDDFNSDMLLVRDNCHAYNPQDHPVRRDCDQVFEFYSREYPSVVRESRENMFRIHTNTSPSAKKQKVIQR